MAGDVGLGPANVGRESAGRETARPAASPGGSMARSLVRWLCPPPIRRYLRREFDRTVRALKAPRMVWGYADANGAWRPRTRVSDTVFIYHPERVRMADQVFVWHYTILDGTGGLEIGEGTQIGAWVGIFTHSSHIAIRLYGHHYQEVPEAQKVAFGVAPVRVGRFVFIAAGSKILPGVTIGDGALVAAGSVVRGDVAPFTIVSGNPAKAIGSTRGVDGRYLDDPAIRAWYEEWQAGAAPGDSR